MSFVLLPFAGFGISDGVRIQYLYNMNVLLTIPGLRAPVLRDTSKQKTVRDDLPSHYCVPNARRRDMALITKRPLTNGIDTRGETGAGCRRYEFHLITRRTRVQAADW